MTNLPSEILHDLDERQTHAVELLTQTNLTRAEIATQAGYATESSVNRFLNSQKGTQAVRAAVMQQCTLDGVLGIQTLRTLAKHAKSEKVRYDAAAKLVDMAGLGKGPGEPSNTRESRDISISISLGKSEDDNVVDVTPQEISSATFQPEQQAGGVGENRSGAGVGDPAHADKTQVSGIWEQAEEEEKDT